MDKQKQENRDNREKEKMTGTGKEQEYPGLRLEKMRKRKAQIRRRVTVLILLVLFAAAGAGIALFMPSRAHVRPEVYFARKVLECTAEGGSWTDEEEQQLSEALTGSARAIVLQTGVDPRLARMNGEQLYLPYELVYEELNGRFFWDEESQVMLFTTPLALYELTPDSTAYQVDGEEEKASAAPVIRAEDALYVSAEFVQQFTNVEYITGEDWTHVRILYRWESVTCAECKKETALRVSADIKADIAQDLPSSSEVTLLEEGEKWALVVSPDGVIGYVRRKHLGEAFERELTRSFEEPEYTSLHLEEKVRLVWHAMDSADTNDYLDQDTKSMTGINVISPTWFSLADNDGHIRSYASEKYVRRAHRKGLQVWALLSNFSEEVSTYQVVSRASARRTLEQELIGQILEYGIDGLNVDLEAITEDSAPGYVQLMRELSILCRKNEIILSVDVPVPMSFNTYYNREELATVADYVIMMGYDEHYNGSEAGSVASLSFEENGIRESLEMIPKEKLVSGIPFYTRVWYTWQEADGSEGVTSEVVAMYRILDDLAAAGREVTWDEQTGQNYSEWLGTDGTRCRVWLEDEQSITLKAELVNTYDLGGFAAWVLGNEKDEIWEVLEDTVKG